MKKLIGILVVGAALGGCSQEYLAQKNAERDEAYCASMGITPGHQNYFQCRTYAAQVRLQEEQQNLARGAALMNYGMFLQQQAQPQYTAPPRPITCYQQGFYTTCQ